VIIYRALADMLAPHRGTKISKPQPRPSLEARPAAEAADDSGSSSVVVLPSSTELFYFYGQSLEQCAKLSAGKALFDLCAVHKKWLRIYAGEHGISDYGSHLVDWGVCDLIRRRVDGEFETVREGVRYGMDGLYLI
jgi:hypothetical protein